MVGKLQRAREMKSLSKRFFILLPGPDDVDEDGGGEEGEENKRNEHRN